MNQEKKVDRKKWILDEKPSVSEHLETESFDVGIHYRVECLMDPPDVKFHIFRYGNSPWPPNMKKWLIQEIDARIADEYTAAYEELADSWFIGVSKFCESRFAPRDAAKSLMQGVIENIVKRGVDDGTLRISRA